jgi:PAS domain S-box-containing protein
VAFFPGEVVEQKTAAPVVLTDFRLFGEAVQPGHGALAQPIWSASSLELQPHSIFSVDFSALHYAEPARTRYRYRLEGLEAKWNETDSTRRTATYTTLPTGSYTLRVQARMSRGDWTESGVALKIRIPPPWYATWYVRALGAVVVLAMLGLAYRRRVRHLERKSRELRDMIETIPAMAWTARPDGSDPFVNRRWKEFTGVSADAPSASRWTEGVHPDDLHSYGEKWRASLAAGEPFESEARFRSVDGDYRWLLARAVPFRDAHGKIVRWYGLRTDITDRKRAEEEREKLRAFEAELAHINRVSMMGELAASIAHEVNQPLAAIVADAGAALNWLATPDPDRERVQGSLRTIEAEGHRAAEVIQRIRGLARKSTRVEKVPLDVNELIQDVLPLVRGEVTRHGISVRIDLASDLPKVPGDRVQLHQVLLNLMMNGIDAMASVADRPRELVLRSRSHPHAGEVLVTVEDAGVGIEPTTADRLFTAFFTTKPGGMGMGLSISRSIIEAHGGRIWITANPAHGATVHLALPAMA